MASTETPTTNQETWRDWIPPGVSDPADEDLITRDQLLDQVENQGVKMHPRTLQILENQGLVPRPIRRWHDGAVRALYAPWVTGLVLKAHYHRSDKRPLEDARADIRDSVKREMFFSAMDAWGGHGIPLEFTRQLQALAKRQADLTGKTIARTETRFLNAEGRAVATLRYDMTTLSEILSALEGEK